MNRDVLMQGHSSEDWVDVIYTYFDKYQEQDVRQGLNPATIVVVGNPIVDILNHYLFRKLDRRIAPDDFAGHKPARHHLPIARSYREDGLD